MNDSKPASEFGILGDSPQKSYEHKLDLFNRFAEAELRQVIAGLDLDPAAAILDAGCGTGLISGWLAAVAPEGLIVGVDVSAGHLARARSRVAGRSPAFIQADMTALPLPANAFDLVWSSNAINHMHRPVDAVAHLAARLRPGGRLVLAQSAFLPEMFFAWDARLEKEVMLATRRYYRDKYGLTEEDTTAARNLLGLMQGAGLARVRVQTIVIERAAPLTALAEQYFVEGVFKGYWDYRLRPYLAPDDWQTVQALCDPAAPEFCLRRPDFHHIQTFTLVLGYRDWGQGCRGIRG